MGKVKSAYLAATSDDMGGGDPAEQAYSARIKQELDEIPDEVYREAELSKFSDDELRAELKRREAERQKSEPSNTK